MVPSSLNVSASIYIASSFQPHADMKLATMTMLAVNTTSIRFIVFRTQHDLPVCDNRRGKGWIEVTGLSRRSSL